MLQLPAIAVEVGLLLSLLIQKAIVFECLQLNTQKSSLNTSKNQIKLVRHKVQAEKEMSLAISFVQYHQPPWWIPGSLLITLLSFLTSKSKDCNQHSCPCSRRRTGRIPFLCLWKTIFLIFLQRPHRADLPSLRKAESRKVSGAGSTAFGCTKTCFADGACTAFVFLFPIITSSGVRMDFFSNRIPAMGHPNKCII